MQPYKINSVSEFHQFRHLPGPEHPLISVLDFDMFESQGEDEPKSLVTSFYCIVLKRNFNGKMMYGHQEYDFNEGVMLFISPGQVYSIKAEKDDRPSGWMILLHPDFLWNSALAKKIKQYEYFSYAVHEALHLSEKEETAMTAIVQNIQQEYHSNIDKFSQALIIAQLELLLTYAERFYHRQFITRKITNHHVLTRLEDILTAYFSNNKGLPTVQYIADTMNISPNYLSGLLKVLSGQSTQQHIHDKVIEVAKEKLVTTSLSVSEIAYDLGFEHPQSFSKLFKNKMNITPLEYRQSFS